jgi:tetratricopeptide (TPR) repeat protein
LQNVVSTMEKRHTVVIILLAGGTFALTAAAPDSFRQGSAQAEQSASTKLVAEARDALSREDYNEAIQALEKLTKIAPDTAEYHALLGMAYYSAGRYRDAILASRQALTLKRGLPSARTFLELSLAESGQCKEVLPDLEEHYLQTSDEQFKRVMGIDAVRCAMALERVEKAVALTQSLNRAYPDNPDVLYLSRQVYSDLSRRVSQRLIQTAPRSYQARLVNAEEFQVQGKWLSAIQEYREVLAMNLHLPEIHFRIGRLLLNVSKDQGTLEEARREFEEELKVDPLNAAAEYEIGEMARRAGQCNIAIERFERARKTQPEFSDALIGLGKSLVCVGRAQEAVEPLEAAARLVPDDPVPHYELSIVYRQVGREEAAKQELAAYGKYHEKLIHLQAIGLGINTSEVEPQTAEPPK